MPKQQTGIKWKDNYERLKNDETDINLVDLANRIGRVDLTFPDIRKQARSFIQRLVRR